VEKNELHTLPFGPHYCVQSKAWMDEDVMQDWVDVVLEPYIKTKPAGIIPILFLDSFRCHMTKKVVRRIQELGVEVIHIPGGCTSLTQPVDVGYNKPFKNRIRDAWEKWMEARWEEIVQSKMTPQPRRVDVSEWVISAYFDMPTTIIQNAWKKDGFAWF